jgi:hypothetical protein
MVRVPTNLNDTVRAECNQHLMPLGTAAPDA